jgi:asparagine synthase (glutamine-hydrolysing)
MCGITGIVNLDDSPVNSDLLRSMTQVLQHRGPDDEGFFLNSRPPLFPDRKWKSCKGKGNVGFGHRRLSIIDLSTGHQPLSNEDQTIWITYNGEVYNFKKLKNHLIDRGHIF